MNPQSIHLYLTSEHPCGYLPDRQATNLVPDPCLMMDMTLYSRLIELGYRRSGAHTYRPHCSNCNACIACRVPVGRFTPNRSQRRCLRRNADCDVSIVEAGYSQEHFALYANYLNTRHADGSMANPSQEDFTHFLFSDWSDTGFLEIREQGRLLAAAVFDRVDSGLSAVYSYFDPTLPGRSLGTLCVLKLLEYTQQLCLEYLYLGYFIRDCDKMQYKKTYQPLQCLQGNHWIAFDESS